MSNISTTLPDASKGSITFAYPKRSLKDKEASEYIGMSESWLRHNRISGQRFGRVAYYGQFEHPFQSESERLFHFYPNTDFSFNRTV